MVEPINMTVIAVVIGIAVVAWVARTLWNAHVTRADARFRKALEAQGWNVVGRREWNDLVMTTRDRLFHDPSEHCPSWGTAGPWDSLRGQTEGASVVREARDDFYQ